MEMNIGLDFDGVITNVGKLKNIAAKTLFKKDIPAEIFKRELVVGSGLLNNQQYTEVQKLACGSGLGSCMEAVEDVLTYLPRLKDDGYGIRIITSRNDAETLWVAHNWLMDHELYFPVIGVGYKMDKIKPCRGLDVYVDDDLDKLEPLVDIVENRFLFSWPYNKNTKLDEKIARRVRSWGELYDIISELNKKIN